MSRRPLFPPVFEALDSRPLIDDFTLRAARQQARQQPPGVPFIFPIVPRDHPSYAGSGELGNELAFSPDSNNFQTVLKMDPWDFPRQWTVLLGMNEPSLVGLVGVRAFEVTALINFGSGGVTQQVEIDWLNGSGISVPGNAFNIIAKYNQLSSDAGATIIPPDLRLRVSLSQWPTALVKPTRSYLHFPNDPSHFIRIPPFAKSVTLSCIAGVAPVTPFDYYTSHTIANFTTDNTLTAIKVGAYEICQFVTAIDFTNQFVGCVQSVPIPPFARYLDLTNIDTTGFASVVQFDIGC